MPPSQRLTAGYGSWKSPITSTLIAAQSIGLSETLLDGSDIYWLELRPRENGRYVVVRRAAGAAAGEDLNREPFSARTRVHEYGGGAWTVSEGTLYFSNDAAGSGPVPDRRLYRLERGASAPVPLTPLGAWRYADAIVDRQRNRWIGVRENHS